MRPRVYPVSRWMAFQVEHFYDSFPNRLAFVHFLHRNAGNVCGFSTVQVFDNVA